MYLQPICCFCPIIWFNLSAPQMRHYCRCCIETGYVRFTDLLIRCLCIPFPSSMSLHLSPLVSLSVPQNTCWHFPFKMIFGSQLSQFSFIWKCLYPYSCKIVSPSLHSIFKTIFSRLIEYTFFFTLAFHYCWWEFSCQSYCHSFRNMSFSLTAFKTSLSLLSWSLFMMRLEIGLYLFILLDFFFNLWV